MSAGAFWAGFSSGPRMPVAERPVAEKDAPPAAAEPDRFEARPCPLCDARGDDRHGDACEQCDGAGVELHRVTGSYEPVGDQPAQLKGEPLPSLADARQRLLDWAQSLTQHRQAVLPHHRYTWTDEQRDDLVLIAAALEDHADRADEAAEYREIKQDALEERHAADLAALEQHQAELEAALETERQRVEQLQAQLKAALEGAATLKVALQMEHRMREQDSVTIGDLTDANTALRGELSARRAS